MERKTLQLRELLFVEPMVQYQLVAGTISNHTNVAEIIRYNQNERMKSINQAMVVVDMDTMSKDDALASVLELLQAAEQSEDCIVAICLVKKGSFVLPKAMYDISKNAVLPVLSFEDITYEQIASQFQFVLQLVRDERLLDYIRSTNSSLYKILNKQGFHHLWSFVERSISKQLFFFNVHMEPLALSEAMTQRIIERQDEWEELRRAFHADPNARGKCMINRSANHSCMNSWVLLKLEADVQLGYVGIAAGESSILDIDVAQVQRAMPMIVSELLKCREITETKKAYKQNFLYDLLHNNLEDASDLIINHGKLWDWDLAKPYQLLLIELHGKEGKKLTHEELRHLQLLIKSSLASNFKTGIVEELNGQIVVMYKDIKDQNEIKIRRERKESAKAIAMKLRQSIIALRPECEVTVGIGKYYPNMEDVCRTYQEAKTALELNKHMSDSHIMHFEDLGVMRLLTNIRDEQLEDFFKEYLEELLLFDTENNTNLLQTLQVYFAEIGNVKSTAKKLFIHTNTLRYRLKKAEEILGVNLQNPGDFVNIYVASFINKLHKG